MSRLKRKRLTADGLDSVTAIANDSFANAEQLPRGTGQEAKRKAEQQRSLFVRSLPASATTESLTALFSESYPLKHATVVLDPATRQSKGYGFVTFGDAEDTQSAKEAFDRTIIDGKEIKVEFAKPRTRQSRGPGDRHDADTSTSENRTQGKPKSPRLIVRNLPWTIKDAAQLSLLFRRFGKVKQVSVPKRDRGLSAGFGFVLLRGYKNAETAMQSLNGKKIEDRVISVDWAVDKDTWMALQPDSPVIQDIDKRQDGHSEENVVSEEDVGNPHDLASSSDVEPESSTQTEKSLRGDRSQESDGNDDGQNPERERMGRREDIDTENDDDEDAEDAEEHDINMASTLFVRNLPFTATDESLFEHFKAFGDLRYARVVLDKPTERSKGVGFVCFYNEQDAASCIQQAPRINISTTPQSKSVGTVSTKKSFTTGC